MKKQILEIIGFLTETIMWSFNNVLVPLSQGIVLLVAMVGVSLSIIVKLIQNNNHEQTKF